MIVENNKLHDMVAYVQKNLEHYQAQTQKLRQEQSLLIEKQRNEYEHKIVDMQKRIESIAIEKLNYQSQYEQLNKVNTILEKDHATLCQKNKEIETHYETLKIKYAELQKTHDQLTNRYQKQSDEAESKRVAIMELQIKLTADSDKLDSLTKELSAANDKIQSLRHEHQFISQEKAHLQGQLKQLQKVISIKEATTVS